MVHTIGPKRLTEKGHDHTPETDVDPSYNFNDSLGSHKVRYDEGVDALTGLCHASGANAANRFTGRASTLHPVLKHAWPTIGSFTYDIIVGPARHCWKASEITYSDYTCPKGHVP